MKKGLLSTILNMLLGIVALVILIAFIWPYVTGFFERGAKVDAENDANQLQYLLNSLSEGQKADYFLYSPKGWNIKSFEWTEEKVPPICIGKNCVCIRTATDINWLKKTYFCRVISKKIVYQGKDLDITISSMKLTFENKKDFYEIISEIKMPEPVKLSDSTKNKLIECNDILEKNYISYIKAASEKYGVEEALIKALICHESDFGNWKSVSPGCGAAGLMQLMPCATSLRPLFENNYILCHCDAEYATRLIKFVNENPYETVIMTDARFDPAKSIDAGASILNENMKKFPSNEINGYKAAIAAYNSGQGPVLKCDLSKPLEECSLPEETEGFFPRVYSYYAYFSSA
jgi:hypothetical protein